MSLVRWIDRQTGGAMSAGCNHEEITSLPPPPPPAPVKCLPLLALLLEQAGKLIDKDCIFVLPIIELIIFILSLSLSRYLAASLNLNGRMKTFVTHLWWA